MAHFAATHKTTGEVQFTQNPNGYDVAEWTLRPISRPPTVFDEYPGRLSKNLALEATVLENSRLAAMTPAERQAEAIAQALIALRKGPLANA